LQVLGIDGQAGGGRHHHPDESGQGQDADSGGCPGQWVAKDELQATVKVETPRDNRLWLWAHGTRQRLAEITVTNRIKPYGRAWP
jgi:hypothetical protein